MKSAWNPLQIVVRGLLPFSVVLLPIEGWASPASETLDPQLAPSAIAITVEAAETLPPQINSSWQFQAIEIQAPEEPVEVPVTVTAEVSTATYEIENRVAIAPWQSSPERAGELADRPEVQSPLPEYPPEPAVLAEDTAPEPETSADLSDGEVESTESDAAAKPDKKAEATPEEDPEVVRRRQLLIEADQLYVAGDRAAAEQLYRQAKDPLWEEPNAALVQPEPITDTANLAPAGQVYWREALAGQELNLETRVLVPLELLVEQYPEFIPGHIQFAEALQQYDQAEKALAVLEQATLLYPNQPDLLQARVQTLADQEEWMQASIVARQFALLNPEHPAAEEFQLLSEQYQSRFRSRMRERLVGNTIANVVTGAVGFALTGSLFGPFSGLDSAITLLQGEESIGGRIANRAQEQLPMVEDEEVIAYVNEVGQRLAQFTGRDEFEYEFFVVLDDSLNAFALPGGKLFVNAGAIAHTQSEAELAGLLAHELAHTVLSHGFQMVTGGNLTANLVQYLPLGNTIANLLVLSYSRDMERQADEMGTQLLTHAGYAADGLHNLMVTLDAQEENRPVFRWLSSHPDSRDRIAYLATMIERSGYNRYAYEGVERHLAVRERVQNLLKKHEAERREQRQRRGR